MVYNSDFIEKQINEFLRMVKSLAIDTYNLEQENCWWKYHMYVDLVVAFRKLQRKYNDVPLFVVGDKDIGELVEKLEQTGNKNGRK